MAISGFEIYVVSTDYVTVDLIVWKRYRQRAPGITELMLDSNPQLAIAHRQSPFIPVGTYIRVPIDLDMIMGKPPTLPTDNLWTDKSGYTL